MCKKVWSVKMQIAKISPNLSQSIRKSIQSRQNRYVNSMQARARMKLGERLSNITHMEEARVFSKLADKNEFKWLSKHPIQNFLLKIFK